MGRGIEKAKIFQSDIDRSDFLDRLAKLYYKGNRSGGRGREVIRVRRIFCQLAVRRMGYSGTEVARYLGVTTSAVNRLAALEESRELLKYS